MRYIVANWKMNKTIKESLHFIKEFNSSMESRLNQSSCNVLIAPPSIHIPLLYHLCKFTSLVGQNISSEDHGAYTGELSAIMLRDYVKYVIIGHSERRKYFNETDQVLCKKLSLCFQYKMKPIFCVGENKNQRNSGDFLVIIKKQLENTIMLLKEDYLCNLLIAYEPVWAIGTGSTPSTDEIQEVHNYIRTLLIQKSGSLIANKIPILYGGSCTAENTKSILMAKNVNGLLVGGASLDSNHFQDIIQISDQIS